MPDAVKIYDTTLRDGCQGAGVSLSLQDKLDIAQRLDAFCVDYVEGGWPGANPKDTQFFAALREQPLRNARLTAFGSTRRAEARAEDDATLRLLLEAETPTVALVAKAWDFHVEAVLRTSLDENLAMVADSVRFLKEQGREVVLDAEHFFDGYGANRDYALSVLGAATEAGADWLVLCDTNGGSLPSQVGEAVEDVVASFETGVGVHCHNDGELAVANTLAAAARGRAARPGDGQRVRRADRERQPVLRRPESRAEDGLHVLGARAPRRPDEALGRDRLGGEPSRRTRACPSWAPPPSPTRAASTCRPWLSTRATYEHVDPGVVGNARHILVSELSGRNNVIERARELGVELDPDSAVAREVASKIKELESEGFQFEDAEASFELLVRRAAGDYARPFEPLAYAVDARKSDGEEATQSTASAEVALGGDVLRGEATGGGPVDALEKAMRRALLPAFPQLAAVWLSDFRSQIARGRDGTRGAVRVRITGMTEGVKPWTTVGSAPDLLHASWLALADCLEYAVLTRAGVSPAVEARLHATAIPLTELAALLRPELDDAGPRRPAHARGDGLGADDARSRRRRPIASSPRTRPRSARRSSTASATSARSPRIRTGARSCASTSSRAGRRTRSGA